ncbi:MAG: hypothetical protein ACRC3B_20090, partial [Bacteroidia bacterium]
MIDSVQNWNAMILNMTMLIHDECPELSKYLDEMQTDLLNIEKPELSAPVLKRYFEMLFNFL